jgi:hypothetical protein
VVHVQCPHQVDGDQPLPFVRGGLCKGLEDIPAGVVDQHIHRPESGVHGLDGGIHLAAAGDVCRHGQRLAPCGGDALRRGLGCRQVAVQHGDLGAFLRQALACRVADAATAPGDNDGLACQTLHKAS